MSPVRNIQIIQKLFEINIQDFKQLSKIGHPGNFVPRAKLVQFS